MTHLYDGPVTGRTVLVTGATSGIGLATPAHGAVTSIHLASAPDLEQVSGRYFANRRPTRSSTRSYDQVVAARLWEASADLVGLTAAPRV